MTDRTNSLATTSSNPVRVAATCEFLTFRLGSVAYGIDILKVQEIRGYEAPTLIAGAPVFMRGLLNLRGVIVPVVDLRCKFGLAQVHFDQLTVTVILTVAGRVVGAVVDSVSDVVALAPAQIKPMPEFDTSGHTHFITGIGTPGGSDQDDLLVLLDIEQLMTSAGMGLTQHPIH